MRASHVVLGTMIALFVAVAGCGGDDTTNTHTEETRTMDNEQTHDARAIETLVQHFVAQRIALEALA